MWDGCFVFEQSPSQIYRIYKSHLGYIKHTITLRPTPNQNGRIFRYRGLGDYKLLSSMKSAKQRVKWAK